MKRNNHWEHTIILDNWTEIKVKMNEDSFVKIWDDIIINYSEDYIKSWDDFFFSNSTHEYWDTYYEFVWPVRHYSDYPSSKCFDVLKSYGKTTQKDEIDNVIKQATTWGQDKKLREVIKLWKRQELYDYVQSWK